MTFDQLISLIKPISVSGPEPRDIGMLTQDSRKVKDGMVFIAVKGFKVDGHDFIEDAISQGAAVIITDQPYEAEEVCVLQVENTRGLLGPLAQAFEGFPTEDINIIGITGTNGKTTVATLVYQVLRELEVKASLLGTVEKRIGDKILDSRLTTADPVELAADMSQMLEHNSRFMVMEVSSHALDQQRTRGLKFDVAAFTNLSHDHLDYHASFEEYAAAKKQLFDGLSPEATAVINADDEQAGFIIEDCRATIQRFGIREDTDINCEVVSNGADGLVLKIGEITIESPLFGMFNAYNIAEAFLICESLGFGKWHIGEALKSATGAPGRMETVTGSGKGNPVVIVDYAHTPNALENVLTTLKELAEGDWKLQVLFGCGGDRDREKRPKMAKIAEQYATLVTVTSDNPRNEEPDAIIDDIMKGFSSPEKAERIVDRQEAITKAIKNATSDTFILIAGKGHETYQEIEGERYPFDDREIASRALDSRSPNFKSNGVG